MKWASSLFASLQKVGKALMLPVSVLPIAGLLLGIGSAELSFVPEAVSLTMKSAGGAIFGQMPLLFAIGVALGFTKNDGVSALAAIVGYSIMIATLGLITQLEINSLIAAGQALTDVQIATIKKTYETGVLGGILSGGMAAFFFNRFYTIQFPSYLGFFSGKRFVPIITGFAAIGLALLLAVIWPPIGSAIAAFSHWAVEQNPEAAFTIFGVVNRALIPFGLHHIWNVPFYFEAGTCVNMAGETVHGILNCYLQADSVSREAGSGFGQLAGGYFIQMYGLPAAAIAIWHSAKPENKVKIGGIMLSGALTSFLTGITEPIEFAFLFVAPVLYVFHALLTGLAYFASNALGIVHGTSFSHGLIDFIVLSANAKNITLIPVIGLMFAATYYLLFRILIVKLDLKTPGREDEAVETETAAIGTQSDKAREIILAYGGAANIKNLDACITRLRIEVNNVAAVNKDRLKQLGATGVIIIGNGVQAIMGTAAENLKTEMDSLITSGAMGDAVSTSPTVINKPAVQEAEPVVISENTQGLADKLLAHLGGKQGVEEVTACAGNRIRMQFKQAFVDDVDLSEFNVIRRLIRVDELTIQLVLNQDSTEFTAALNTVSA